MSKAKRKYTLTLTKLKQELHYDPSTGIFTWLRKKKARQTKVGTQTKKYQAVMINGETFSLHHLAWFYVHGYWPQQLDHKDGNPHHNWISNLRLATSFQNNANRGIHKTNKSGIKGVHWNKNKQKWRVDITHHYKQITIGYFLTKKEARDAYLAAAIRLHEEFARER